ncbi:hypothetical protein [Chitinibacter sp. GC72]|uniref:hypothetical protein n=1 Tax=Chitinibacter sp. GC72 TaxID=1526917 RepID=UPI0012FA70BD|nr:hypothetical protein [Chitinibacter sp. GC72]
MSILALLYLMSILLGLIASIVVFKRRSCFGLALLGAASSLGLLLLASGAYGLFHAFGFWHGSARPGLESAFSYAILAAITVGAPAMIAGSWCAVLLSRFIHPRH